jgi:CHRD domain
MSCARTARRLRIVRARLSLCGARNRVACVIAFGVVFGTAQMASAAGIQVFTATLTGAQQVPAVSSSGTGLGTVILNATESQITVNLTFSGLTIPASSATLVDPAQRESTRQSSLISPAWSPWPRREPFPREHLRRRIRP